MSHWKLSTKILWVSAVVLIIFCFSSVAILFHAQSMQATEEMDQVLNNETFGLASLVNFDHGKFDFEMSSSYLTQYQRRNPTGFFRFFDPASGKILKESIGAPKIDCKGSGSYKSVNYENQIYQIERFNFRPEIETEIENAPIEYGPEICLLVGINEAPFKATAMNVLISTVPLLVGIFILLIGTLLLLVRRLTLDISILTKALSAANFNATYAFPSLPEATTPEVNAVVVKLAELHTQAAEVYRDMWLFLGRAAHQIKTPVAALQATVEVLLRKDRTKEELLVGFEDVQVAINLLSVLTKKLILSSRISYQEISEMETISLQEFFSELIVLFRSKADSNGVQVKLETTLDVSVMGNHFLLNDIFGNILENAIVYSTKGSKAVISISWETINGQVQIKIADQGPGFPQAVLSSLFQPFIRGDERMVAGSGLGLSIAKKSVQLLRGEIHLVNSTAHGSEILVTLPQI